MRIRLFLLVACVATSHAADQYVGAWHNKKEGFYNSGFALRENGRGVFSGATMPALLRWKRIDSGIILTIAGQRLPTELKLTYVAASNSFVSDDARMGPQVYWQISKEQPPDLEAESETKRAEQAKSIRPLELRKQDYSTAEALMLAVQSWLDSLPPKPKNAMAAFIRPADSKWQIYLRRFSSNYSIEIPIVRKAVDQPTPNIYSQAARIEDEPDLPVKFALPKRQIEEIRKAMATRGITPYDGALESRTPWAVEVYSSSMSFSFRDDRDAFLEAAHFLIYDVFRGEGQPWLLSVPVIDPN